jgi:hypothetical protein
LEIFLVCFEKFLFVSVVSTGPKHRNKPKKMFFGFVKQTEKQSKQIEFRFEPKKKFDCFEDTLLLNDTSAVRLMCETDADAECSPLHIPIPRGEIESAKAENNKVASGAFAII